MIKVVKLQHFANSGKPVNIDFDSSALIPAKSADSNHIKISHFTNSPRHQYYDTTFLHGANNQEKNHHQQQQQQNDKQKLFSSILNVNLSSRPTLKALTPAEINRNKESLIANNEGENVTTPKKSSLSRSKSANEVTIAMKYSSSNLSRLNNIDEKGGADLPTASMPAPVKRSILKKQNLRQKKIIEWAKKKANDTKEPNNEQANTVSRSANNANSNANAQHRGSLTDDEDFNKFIGDAAAAVITKTDIERNLRLKIFESELLDLSKARYKTLEMIDYQKRVFIERQLRKAKSLPGLLRCTALQGAQNQHQHQNQSSQQDTQTNINYFQTSLRHSTSKEDQEKNIQDDSNEYYNNSSTNENSNYDYVTRDSANKHNYKTLNLSKLKPIENEVFDEVHRYIHKKSKTSHQLHRTKNDKLSRNVFVNPEQQQQQLFYDSTHHQSTSNPNLIVRKSTKFQSNNNQNIIQGYGIKSKHTSTSTNNGDQAIFNGKSQNNLSSNIPNELQVNEELLVFEHNSPIQQIQVNNKDLPNKDGSRLSHNTEETQTSTSVANESESLLAKNNRNRNVTFALNQIDKQNNNNNGDSTTQDTKAIINEVRLQRNSIQFSENQDSLFNNNNNNNSDMGSIQSRNSNNNINNNKKVVSLRLQFSNTQSNRIQQQQVPVPRTPGTDKSNSTNASLKPKSLSFRDNGNNRKLTAKLNYFTPIQKNDDKFELLISRMNSTNQTSAMSLNQQPLSSNSKFIFDVGTGNDPSGYSDVTFSPISNPKNPISDNRFQDLLKIVKPPYLLDEVKDVNRIIERNDALKSQHLDLDSREKLIKTKEKGYKLAVKARQLIDSGEYEV